MRGPLQFLRHWFKELSVATVLAIVAAIWVDYHHEHKRQQTINQNRRAVAEVLAFKNQIPIGQGSGIFINQTGLLLTNSHVIQNADNLVAKLPTGAYYQLKEIKGENKSIDVAILQFDAQETPYVHGLGDSARIDVGDKVVAIGAPLGLESSVSEGIISNPKRTLRGVDFIQFTASISPGSSGGGLFDAGGALLGLTSAAMASGPELEGEAIAQNLNLAVPINLVKDAIAGVSTFLTEGRPEYYYSRGIIAENRHDFDQAAAAYRKAVELDDRYLDAYMGLGMIYYETGDYAQEVVNYEKAVEIDPSEYDAQYYLGAAYEDLGEYGKAIEKYQAALTIKPQNKDAMHDLIVVYLAQGRRDEASALIPKLKELDQGEGRLLELLLKRSK